MSEISITRFVPATATREKVNSVETTSNDPNDSGSSRKYREEKGNLQQDNLSEEILEIIPNQNRDGGEDETPLELAVAKLNEYVQTVQRDIIFGIDGGTMEPSVTVVDRASRKIVRQFGGKEALELAKKVDSQEPLTLFNTQV